MNDLLRAWNLLGEDERPEGMRLVTKGNRGKWRDGVWHLTRNAAYDRLTLALERRLLVEYGYELMHGGDGRYHWGDHCQGEWTGLASDPDRLAAACLAAESMGGGE